MTLVQIKAYFTKPISIDNKIFQNGKVVSELLSNSHGYSAYGVQIYVGKISMTISIHLNSFEDVLRNFYEKYKNEIKILFYRHSENERHFINCLYTEDIFPNKNHLAKKERICRYGFNSIRFNTTTVIESEDVRKFKDNMFWIGNIKGSFPFYSECDDNNINKENKLFNSDFAQIDIDNEIISDKPVLFQKILEISSSIEYYYSSYIKRYYRNEKLVGYTFTIDELESRGLYELPEGIPPDSRMNFLFDSWHNCVDEFYLDFETKRREKEEAEYRRRQELKRDKNLPF